MRIFPSFNEAKQLTIEMVDGFWVGVTFILFLILFSPLILVGLISKLGRWVKQKK